MRECSEAGDGSRLPVCRASWTMERLKLCSKGLGKTLRVFKQGSDIGFMFLRRSLWFLVDNRSEGQAQNEEGCWLCFCRLGATQGTRQNR